MLSVLLSLSLGCRENTLVPLDSGLECLATAEICDGADNDCDGLVDDADPDVTGASTWFDDSDGDGYGGQDGQTVACVAPAGFVAKNTDCDDRQPGVHPHADEICDGLDNDCDDLVDGQDDSLSAAPTWYRDADGDGYGGEPSGERACEAPIGEVADGTDCDDADAAVHPGAAEVCDDRDDDCDGLVDGQDDSLSGGSTFYFDADGDGLGDPEGPASGCHAPAGTVDNALDCDDTDPDVGECTRMADCDLVRTGMIHTSGIASIGFDADWRQILAPAYSAGSYVAVYDADTLAAETTFSTGSLPNTSLADPFGDHVWVGNASSGTVTIVDRGTFAAVTTLTGFCNPVVGQDPVVGTVYVFDVCAQTIFTYDPITLAPLDSLAVDFNIGGGAFGDGKLYLAGSGGNVRTIDTATLSVVDSAAMPVTLAGCGLVPGEDRLFAPSNESANLYLLDASTLNVVDTITTISRPYVARLSDDQSAVAVTGGVGLYLLDPATGATLSTATACDSAQPIDVVEDVANHRWLVTCATSEGIAVMGCR
jgi:hypothetical protein